eukprot:TRINITY_DN42202_c0_g1_i2.p1 TRINITY_DN42202_c0_g1~~TRINITY_DN42202_c0_g1_i2.p1  ORF type:complete len:433 (+),score=26.94 TRINITY_DN42202_c0_g1_i2:335-1633(+)
MASLYAVQRVRVVDSQFLSNDILSSHESNNYGRAIAFLRAVDGHETVPKVSSSSLTIETSSFVVSSYSSSATVLFVGYETLQRYRNNSFCESERETSAVSWFLHEEVKDGKLCRNVDKALLGGCSDFGVCMRETCSSSIGFSRNCIINAVGECPNNCNKNITPVLSTDFSRATDSVVTSNSSVPEVLFAPTAVPITPTQYIYSTEDAVVRPTMPNITTEHIKIDSDDESPHTESKNIIPSKPKHAENELRLSAYFRSSSMSNFFAAMRSNEEVYKHILSYPDDFTFFVLPNDYFMPHKNENARRVLAYIAERRVSSDLLAGLSQSDPPLVIPSLNVSVPIYLQKRSRANVATVFFRDDASIENSSFIVNTTYVHLLSPIRSSSQSSSSSSKTATIHLVFILSLYCCILKVLQKTKSPAKESLTLQDISSALL